MKNFLIKNWKTGLSGILILTLVGLYVYKIIDTEQFLTIFATLTGIGLIVGKDGDKTGIGNIPIILDAPEDIGGGGIKNPPKP